MMNMADMGRFGDNNVAHVQTGEMVVPRSVLDNNPALKVGIQKAIAIGGNDPRRYTVGTPRNSINPMTGQPEFFDLKKLVPGLVTLLFPGIGSAIGGALGLTGTVGNVVGSAITGALTSGLTGGSPMHGAITGGLGGAFLPDFPSGETGKDVLGKTLPAAAQKGLGKVAEVYPMAQLANIVGLPLDSKFGQLLNTRAGDAVSMGLLAQLLSSGDKDEDLKIDPKKFGSAKDFKSTPLVDYSVSALKPLGVNRGGTIFPRRDGAIMPYEGGGQVDDVPAMLTAGEFVLTKDAVKGLGGGNQNVGIQRAYDMMGNLERMA
jgi:hypothetical protein